MIARVVLAVVSVCIAGALGIQLYARERLESGQNAVFLAAERPLPPERRAAVLDDLRAAERLRPGTQAILPAALVHHRAGRQGAAQRLAQRAVRREPRNAVTWRVLATVLARSDPAEARRAAAIAARLDPVTAGPRGSRSSR